MFEENSKVLQAKDNKDALDKIAGFINELGGTWEDESSLTRLRVDRLFDDCDLVDFSNIANQVVGDHLESRSLLWKCLKSVDEDIDGSYREFDIKASCTIKKGDNYNRPAEYIIQELERQEGEALVAVLEDNLRFDNDKLSGPMFGKVAAEDLKYKIERMKLVLDKLVINRDILFDIVRSMSKLVDPVGQRELILMGYLGNYDNTMIITQSGYSSISPIQEGVVYGLIDPEHLGVFGFKEKIKNVLKSKGKDSFTWDCSETIRIKILNSRGIARWRRNKNEVDSSNCRL